MNKTDILILGSGLTGLTLAYLLRNTNRKVVIAEARDRIGGRILTAGGQDQATIEMGATWFGPAHTKLKSLLDELGLRSFEQKLGSKAIYEATSMSPHQLVTLPQEQQTSYRIEGGSSALINALVSHLKHEQLILGERAEKISMDDDDLIVKCTNTHFKAQMVVSTLPPKLLTETIEFEPELPDRILDVAAGTHTWMGESIKFGLSYDEPFWLKKDTSGTVFSNVGPVNEMYDHSSRDGDRNALKGFLNGHYFSVSKEERLDMILEQLRKYYGSIVDNYRDYYEMVWTNEPLTYTPYHNHVLPHQNNGHKVFREPYFDHKLFIVGAETSEVAPGYMEGAIHSAHQVYKKIIGTD